MNFLQKAYYNSHFRSSLHHHRRTLAGKFRSLLIPSIELTSVGLTVATFADTAPSTDKFEVILIDKSTICDGNMGNLYFNRKYILDSHDGTGRQKQQKYRQYININKTHDFALSLHTAHSSNYYHFLVHTLPKVIYAEAAFNDLSFPILVSERLANTRFFQGARDMGYFGRHPIIVQRPQENLEFKSLAFIKPSHSPLSHVDAVLERLGCTFKPVGASRVYIHRNNHSPNGRTIRNFEEVTRALNSFDFHIIDPQDYSLSEQINLFSQASKIVSPHGAGLTNILYRAGGELSVVEIFSPNLRNHCYKHICEKYNFTYQSFDSSHVVGKSTRGSSVVDCNKLQSALEFTCRT